MFKRYERGRGNAACGIGENREARIRDKWLGSKVFWRLKRNREIRQILEIDGEVTARPLPQPLSIEWRGWPQAGRGPTGRAKLPLSPIQSSVTVSLGQPSWVDEDCGPTVRDFRYRFKCITVIHLIRGCAVTACDFHVALLERGTGGIDWPTIRSKPRLDRERRQRRACPAIRFWVALAAGVCQPVPVPRRSADIPVCGCWGLSSPQFATTETIAELESSANPQAGKPALPVAASPFRSAGRRPARAGRPCYPFSLNTFNHKSLDQIMSNISL